MDDYLVVCLAILWSIAFFLIGVKVAWPLQANRLCRSSGYDAGAERIRGDWYCILEEPDQELFRLDELIRDAGR